MTSQVAHFRDSVSPELIGTKTCDGVLAYANGRYAWPKEEIERFIEAGKRVHKVDVNGNAVQLADILDVEPFDAAPNQVAAWVDERWRTHSTAAVYCSRSTVPSVITELRGRAVLPDRRRLDGRAPHADPGPPAPGRGRRGPVREPPRLGRGRRVLPRLAGRRAAVNQYVKVALVVLGAVAVGVETAYPHAAWAVPVAAGITALLTMMHVTPTAPANES